jgi:4-amino-4-deoxy-L-arabinose transferase-like glycosyltransferase
MRRADGLPPTAWLIAALVLASASMVLPGLGASALWDSDETRRALAAWEMLRTGDWVVPRLLGDPFPYYPPLAYWLIALLALPSGGSGAEAVTPTIARLPSALSAIALVLVVFWIGARTMDRARGFASALVLTLLPLFVSMGRIVGPDMTLVLLQSVLIALWVEWQTDVEAAAPTRRWLVPAMVGAAGLGVLAKGPVALAFPGLVAVAHALATGRARMLLRFPWLRAGLCVVAVALPWYLALGMREGAEFLYSNVVVENLLAPAGLDKHVRGTFYYAPRLFIRALPWTVVLLPVAVLDRSWRRPETRLGWVWFGLIALVLTLSASKRPSYMLFLMPPLALLLGDAAGRIWLALAPPIAPRLLKLVMRLAAPLALAAVIAILLRPDLVPRLEGADLPRSALLVLGAATVPACLLGGVGPRAALACTALATAVWLFLNSALLGPAWPTQARAGASFCDGLRAQVPRDAPLQAIPGVPYGLFLCAGREVQVNGEPPPEAYLVTDEDFSGPPTVLAGRARLHQTPFPEGGVLTLWSPRR